MRDKAIACIGRRPDVMIARKARQHRPLVGDIDVQRVDELDGVAAARVIAPPHQTMSAQFVRLQFQALADGGGHRLGRMVEGQFQAGQSDHGRSP